jgi:tetratricopeptide (TPR) repeat protein
MELLNWSRMSLRPVSILAGLLGAALLLGGASRGFARQDPEVARAIAEELRQDAVMIRRGQARQAARSLEEMLAETPGDAEARRLLAEARFELAAYPAALAEGEKALAAAVDPALKLACARSLAQVLVALGRAKDAVGVLEQSSADPSRAQDAWALACALWDSGDRARARKVLESGAKTPDEQDWQGLLARGQCLRRLGDLHGASKSFVGADRASRAEEGSSEPDVLAALGDLYFESEREVQANGQRSSADLYKQALELAPGHEPSLLGMYRLHRTNWQRHSRTAQDILDELLAVKPDSIEAGIAGASSDLDDGLLKSCRERLSKLGEAAPGRREVRTLRASLAWVEHQEEACRKELEALAAEDKADATPER